MQSPNYTPTTDHLGSLNPAPAPSIDADHIRTRALGCVALAGIVLVLPVICAVFFYFAMVAALNFHSMVAAIRGVV